MVSFSRKNGPNCRTNPKTRLTDLPPEESHQHQSYTLALITPLKTENSLYQRREERGFKGSTVADGKSLKIGASYQ